jgi:hypothetical protein
MPVAENIFCGREERGSLGWINRRRILEKSRHRIEHGFNAIYPAVLYPQISS